MPPQLQIPFLNFFLTSLRPKQRTLRRLLPANSAQRTQSALITIKQGIVINALCVLCAELAGSNRRSVRRLGLKGVKRKAKKRDS